MSEELEVEWGAYAWKRESMPIRTIELERRDMLALTWRGDVLV